MSDYLPAFERMLANEGGYKLTDIKGDRGRQTFAGIARRLNPKWPGWIRIDAGSTPTAEMVRDFYRVEYWDRLRCGSIVNQKVAQSLFDFGVNAGVATSAKLAQIVVGVTPDGQIGLKSLAAINNMESDLFILAFSLAKIARYRDIVTKDRSQAKFLLGWINRTLKEAA